MDQKILYGDNIHYSNGVIYEVGIGVKRDYKKALECYKKGMEEGHLQSKIKVRETHLDFKVVVPTILFSLIVLIYTSLKNLSWVGFFVAGIILLITSSFKLNKYWYKIGYANIINLTMFFGSIFIFLPLSAVIPYLRGVTYLPLNALMVIGFFIFGAGIIFLIINRNKSHLKMVFSGLFLTLASIMVYFIPVEDVKYRVEDYLDGVWIVDYRSNESYVEIPKVLNNKKVKGIAPYAFRSSSVEKVVVGDHIEY